MPEYTIADIHAAADSLAFNVDAASDAFFRSIIHAHLSAKFDAHLLSLANSDAWWHAHFVRYPDNSLVKRANGESIPPLPYSGRNPRLPRRDASGNIDRRHW